MIPKENDYFILDSPGQIGIKSIIKNSLSKISEIKYKMILNHSKPKITEKKYNVSICAIFKNEAPYLREWIEFNHVTGIEHFYLYNNNSEDDFRSVLEPYIHCGLVTLSDWPYNQKQMDCYKTCIEDYGAETKWLGFIDIDEFIVPKKVDTIYEFLKPFEKNRGAVLIYWRLFGSSGLLSRDIKRLVTEDFTVCWPKYCDIGKCFYNTAFEFDKNSDNNKLLHHKFWISYRDKDIPPVNIFDNICLVRDKANTMDFPIQINHYFTKSREEYIQKCAKGDVYFKLNPHDEEYFFEHEMKCTYTDYSAFKYMIKLKMSMERNVVK